MDQPLEGVGVGLKISESLIGYEGRYFGALAGLILGCLFVFPGAILWAPVLILVILVSWSGLDYFIYVLGMRFSNSEFYLGILLFAIIGSVIGILLEKKERIKIKLIYVAIVIGFFIILISFTQYLKYADSKILLNKEIADFSECDKLSVYNSGSLSTCYINVVINKNDVSLCQRIENLDTIEDKWPCYMSYAITKNDSTTCEKIESFSRRTECYTILARNNFDVSLCKKIESYESESVKGCIASVNRDIQGTI